MSNNAQFKSPFGIRWAGIGAYIPENTITNDDLTQLVETFPGQIESVTFRKPTLEDVFVHHTGHQFWSEKSEDI